MKAERRHELQHNELADILVDFGEKVKPYAKLMLGLALAVVVIVCAYLYLAHRAKAEESAAWNQAWKAIEIQDSDGLRKIVKDYPNKPPALWSQLVLADLELSRGVGNLFTQKSAGTDQIRTALEDYQNVSEHAAEPLLREHALFGIGRAQESLGKLTDARAAYEQVIKEFPGGPYKFRAQQRLEQLASDSAKNWYDWFAKQSPAASPGSGGTLNPFENNGPGGVPFPPSSDIIPNGPSKTAPPVVVPTVPVPKLPLPKPVVPKAALPRPRPKHRRRALQKRRNSPAKPEAAKPEAAKPEAGKAADTQSSDKKGAGAANAHRAPVPNACPESRPRQSRPRQRRPRQRRRLPSRINRNCPPKAPARGSDGLPVGRLFPSRRTPPFSLVRCTNCSSLKNRSDSAWICFWHSKFPTHSRVQLRKAINAATVEVDGRRAKAAHRLRLGEQVRLTLPEIPRERAPAREYPARYSLRR